MGTIHHKAIIVTSFDERGAPTERQRLTNAHKKAKKLFPKGAVSNLSGLGINGYKSFLVAPCGSKLGWEDAQIHEEACEKFVEYLDEQKFGDGSTCVKYVVVEYGELGLQVQTDQGHDVDEEEIYNDEEEES